MACAAYRDALSARLDDELPADELERLEAHLTGCADCREWDIRTRALHRTVRVRPADQVPDLRAPILAAVDPHRPADPARRARPATSPATTWLRWGLVVVGLTMVVLALPSVVGLDAGSTLHVSRELGVWDAAFGAGLVVAAWQPERARGLLPMALVLGGTMAVVAVLDVIAGQAPFLHESSHLIELLGMALLWALARRTDDRPARPVDASWPTSPRRTTWHAA